MRARIVEMGSRTATTWGLAACVVAAACGSERDGDLFQNPACGAGTTLVDGQCVIVDAVAPGPSSEAGTNETPRDGDGGADAGWTADLCPAGPLWVNCSQTCGVAATACSRVDCSRWLRGVTDPQIARAWSSSRPILRTPQQPGNGSQCRVGASTCDPTLQSEVMAPTALLAFRIESDSPRYRISVGEPWIIEEATDAENLFCIFKRSRGRYYGCGSFDRGKTFLVWTDDPNAPTRNIVVEPIESNEGCP
jgi:hypothetical protein